MSDTSPQPIEARCDRCKQIRPLFRYEPDHDVHLNPMAMAGCRWCNCGEQPLLCVRCYDKEAEREDADPALSEEGETWSRILAGNARHEARRQADMEAVAGIAAASGMGGA